jgi:hypothetical protein
MVILEILQVMNMTRFAANAANTLTEVLIAVLLIGTFFASIFELNAVCLRYIAASKQSVAAIAAVQDRAEVLRNLAFSDLTTTSYVQNLLATAADGSDYVKNMTEVVQLSAYPTANGVTQLTRHTDGSVTLNSTATSLGTTLVKLDISQSWTAVLNGRSRSEQSSTIISNGSKK